MSEANDPSLDDVLDTLVSEYSDAIATGQQPRHRDVLGRVPAPVRPGLERVLKMIDAGLARPAATSAALVPGAAFDQYRLERELGRGGMAVVWLAHDTALRRPVALKILRPGLAVDPRHVDRFEREALAIASLRHPHVVQIHGVGESHGHHWLAMEYVEGPSLATVLQALPNDRPRTADDLARAAGIASLASRTRDYEQAVATLLAPAVDALSAAHAHGLVHRDVKPSNILIHGDGRAVLVDFGLAKADADPALSLTGEGLGTPYYMSPEQAHLTGVEVDHRTDIYSFGVTLYEALAGVRPFRGGSFLEVIESIRRTVPPSIRALARERSADAAAVVRRAMAHAPEERYATAIALRDDLEALAEGRATKARAEQGGPLRRLWAGMRSMSRGQGTDYRSATTVLGLPLVHFVGGPRLPGVPARIAKGWLACGETAYGGIALGRVAVGGIACGGVACGLVSWGGLAAGLLSSGGLALGAVTFAGIGLAWVATGGVVAGYVAVGGMARGHWAAGGMAKGEYVVTDRRVDPEAELFFEELFGSVSGFFSAGFGL